jgi:hypothetical protein
MLDYLAIFKKFNEKGVRYIVVGGIAVNLHGIPRMTYDIDLLLDLEDDNLRRFLRLVKGWGFKPKIPVDIMEFAEKDKRQDWIKNRDMKAFTLINPEWAVSEIDVIIDSPVDYGKACRGVKRFRLHDIRVPLISIDDLIKMKRKSGRQQDRDDIRYLRRLKDEEKKRRV